MKEQIYYAIAMFGLNYDTDGNCIRDIRCLYAVSISSDEVIDRFMRHPDTTEKMIHEFDHFLQGILSSLQMIKISEAVYYRALEIATVPISNNDLHLMHNEDGVFILESELT